MEEVRTIVGGRPYVESVVAEKLFPALASGKEGACCLEVIIAVQYIKTVMLVRRDAGKIGCIEQALFSPLVQGRQFRSPERFLLHQERSRCPTSYQRSVGFRPIRSRAETAWRIASAHCAPAFAPNASPSARRLDGGGLKNPRKPRERKDSSRLQTPPTAEAAKESTSERLMTSQVPCAAGTKSSCLRVVDAYFRPVVEPAREVMKFSRNNSGMLRSSSTAST